MTFTRKMSSPCKIFTFSRIVINQNPPLVRSVLEDAERERKNSLDSQFDSLEETYPWLKAEPSPFTSNPAMYEREEVGNYD